MASFGGTVKLQGESEYRKALSQITQSLRETSSALTLVDSQYSKNDNSIATVTAKNEKLNAILDKQKSAYETLKNSFTNINAKYNEQINTHAKLQAEYDQEKAKLDKLKNTVGENSSAYEKQKAKVADLATELSKSQSNIDANETAMSRLRVQMNSAETAVNKTAKEISDLGKETEQAGEEAKKGGEGFTVFKGIIANLGTQAINGAINGIKSLGSAFINLGKQAIASYSDYEQLSGGVETLFKDSSGIVESYANNAYKTAGLSANEYMETVTSFSASLLQSLNGDTAKSAEVADMAITDMSDNANKMGTSMESIQNAYQGFAKQNYTMLDNLKLGYGGTKEEMQRLLTDAEKVTGIKYDISNLNDVYSAIHVIQGELGVTGTTAKEASSTISGSANAMKSAWSNLLTGIADDNSNFGQLIENLVDSVITFGDNIIPRIQTTIKGIASMVSGLLKEIVPKLVEIIPPLITDTLPILLDAVQTVLTSLLGALPQVVQSLSSLIPSIVQMLLSMLPQLIDVGINVILTLIQGITEALPQIIEMLPTVIMQIVDVLMNNLPLIIDTGIELIFALVDGLIEALPQLIEYIPEIIDKVITAISENLPKIIEAGITLTIKLAEGLIKALPQLISKIPQIMGSFLNGIINYYGNLFQIGINLLSKLISGIGSMLGSLGAKAGEIVTTIFTKISELPQKMLNIGKNIVEGLWNGISNMTSWVIGKIQSFGDSVLGGIKSFFGIASPSKLFKNEVGKYLAEGIGVGFTDEMKDVTKDMQGAIPTSFDTSINGSYNDLKDTSSISSPYGFTALVEAFKTALSEMKIELDDDEMGKFIDKTVARTIYT